MQLSDFLTPVNVSSFLPKNGFYTTQLGALTDFYQVVFPEINDRSFDLAIVGVLEDRNAVNNQGTALAPDHFREKFYSLHGANYQMRVADLGNIKAGAKVSDTYIALKLVITELIRNNIIPVIIGGGQD